MVDSAAPKRTGWRLGIAWMLQFALAAVFLFTASRKFMGHPIPVATVEALGAGQWLRIAIGVAELAGAVGLLVPRLAGLAASCLALLMLGAVATHLFVIGGSAVLAVVLLVASATVAYLRGWRP